MKQQRSLWLPRFFLEFWLTSLLVRRNRNFPPALRVLATLPLLVGSTASAQGQAPPPSPKIYHEPRTLPRTKFYDAPDPLPAGKPGELIRTEPFDEYHLSGEITAFRILYHSRSPHGDDVAVSGVVLLPDRTPPSGGWPVVGWAHDFTGAARLCAPSLLKNLNEGPILSMYIGLGYAVVATDYAGLGTAFPHAVSDIRSNALDVIYSVPAARAAVPQLGVKWVGAGYSQGAIVAVGVAEAESEIGDPNYLGTVATSGVAEPQEIFAHLARGPDQSMLVFLAKGIKTVFPEFRVEEILTDKAVRLYQYIGQACDVRSAPEQTASELLKPGWEKNRYVQEFFARNRLGDKATRGPLLVISGETDSAVPFSLTAQVLARMCGQKDRVLAVKYPGINSSAVLGNSVSEQISWIRARFAGLPAPGNCP